MKLKTVTFDGDLEDADREDLVDAVESFEKAQEENAAEFEAAQDKLKEALGEDTEFDELFGEVEEFATAKDSLIEEITEFESFEEAPLKESVLEASDFDELREYKAYFADLDADSDGDGGDGDFSDMGERQPTETGEDVDADQEFAEEYLHGMAGFQGGE